jgi:hypothetical protein
MLEDEHRVLVTIMFWGLWTNNFLKRKKTIVTAALQTCIIKKTLLPLPSKHEGYVTSYIHHLKSLIS